MNTRTYAKERALPFVCNNERDLENLFRKFREAPRAHGLQNPQGAVFRHRNLRLECDLEVLERLHIDDRGSRMVSDGKFIQCFCSHV